MESIAYILLSSSVGIFIYGTLKFVSDIMTRVKMSRREKELESRGIAPYGSTLYHGMVFNKETNKIESIQGKSMNWYRRLIN